MSPPRFALIGAAGFVAPRHLQAIKDVGGKLVAALDPHDAVGILDRFDRDTEFFTEPERFERHLEMLRREGNPIDWLSVCSPNYLHDSHIRMGLRAGAKVICEKPLVLDPKNLDALAEVEQEIKFSGADAAELTQVNRRVFTVLQLRHMPQLVSLHTNRLAPITKRSKVSLLYVTPRGRWYQRSWKGSEEKSGGVVMNIGVHMLDALTWIWGACADARINIEGGRFWTGATESVSGEITLERADVNFTLSIEHSEPVRKLTVDDHEIDFTTGFEGLHSTVYAETLAGRGHGIEDARPAIELAYRLRRG